MDIVQFLGFGTQGVHIANQSVFGGAIGRTQGHADATGYRTDPDNMPAAVLDHMGQQ